MTWFFVLEPTLRGLHRRCKAPEIRPSGWSSNEATIGRFDGILLARSPQKCGGTNVLCAVSSARSRSNLRSLAWMQAFRLASLDYHAPNKIRFRKKVDFRLYYSFFIIHYSLFIWCRADIKESGRMKSLCWWMMNNWDGFSSFRSKSFLFSALLPPGKLCILYKIFLLCK